MEVNPNSLTMEVSMVPTNRYKTTQLDPISIRPQCINSNQGCKIKILCINSQASNTNRQVSNNNSSQASNNNSSQASNTKKLCFKEYHNPD